jgi:hypothetical protein
MRVNQTCGDGPARRPGPLPLRDTPVSFGVLIVVVALGLVCSGCSRPPDRVERAKGMCRDANVGTRLATWQPTTVGHIRRLVVGPQPVGGPVYVYGDAFAGARDSDEAAFCWSLLGGGRWQSFGAGPEASSVRFGVATGFRPTRATGPELPT